MNRFIFFFSGTSPWGSGMNYKYKWATTQKVSSHKWLVATVLGDHSGRRGKEPSPGSRTFRHVYPWVVIKTLSQIKVLAQRRGPWGSKPILHSTLCGSRSKSSNEARRKDLMKEVLGAGGWSAGGHIKKIRKFQITTKFRIILGMTKMPYIFDFIKI